MTKKCEGVIVATSAISYERKTATRVRNFGLRNAFLGLSLICLSSLYTYSQNAITSDKGVTINGVIWATRNVDKPGTFAPTPESHGKFYQWNRKVPYPATGNILINWNFSIPTGTTWETANDPCPKGWRVPTETELLSLIHSGADWITRNGVNGKIFGRDNTVFLPASGGRISDGILNSADEEGYYWSSEHYESVGAYFIAFNYGTTSENACSRIFGFPVRCVADTKINNTDTSNLNVPNVSDGVTINGVTWATCNVNYPGTFTPTPESPGRFYQWNRKVSYPATGNILNWNDSYPTGETWETANDPCPKGWRVPSAFELISLVNSESSIWTTVNGINGRLLGSGANIVFLPASGLRNCSDGLLSGGSYWCSDSDDSGSYAGNFIFISDIAYTKFFDRIFACSVRCVKEN